MNSVCACTPMTVCVRVCVCTSCRDHSASAASLISQHRGTSLNSKRGLERTRRSPRESLRLPSTHSGHSSYHTLFSCTMSKQCCCWSAQNVCDEGIAGAFLCFSVRGVIVLLWWFLQAAKGKTVARQDHKCLFPLNNGYEARYNDYIMKYTPINVTMNISRFAHQLT